MKGGMRGELKPDLRGGGAVVLNAEVRGLTRRSQEAEGISGDLPTACRYGRWAVREAVQGATVSNSAHSRRSSSPPSVVVRNRRISG